MEAGICCRKREVEAVEEKDEVKEERVEEVEERWRR